MHIACSINKEYLQHLCAMLSSLSLNSIDKGIFIHILSNDLDENDMIYLKSLFDNFIFSFYKVNESIFKNIPIVASHLKVQTFYRLQLQELLPNSIEKILYIDADIIINSDIKGIYNLDIEEYYLAAVVDIHEYILDKIQIENALNYFNAGFILINLKKWREDNFLNKCLDYAKHNPEKLFYADQDILNGVLMGKWYRLPLTWNVTRSVYENTNSYLKYFNVEVVNELVNRPKVIHFTSKSKPWHYFDEHPHKEKYFYYLDKVGIAYVKYPELKNFINKKIVLFGASKMGEKVTEIIWSKGMNVHCYIDNNKEKWGRKFMGKEIFSPDYLLEDKANNVLFIASQYEDEIANQILEMGLIEKIHFYRNIYDF